MVLRKWIVPDPDPSLHITFDKIDYTKFTFKDIRWIYSTDMKQYLDEFLELDGFLDYSDRISLQEKLRREKISMSKNQTQKLSPFKPPPTISTPPIIKTPRFDKLSRQKKQIKNGPLKSSKLLDYETTINKYVVSYNRPLVYKSESCTLS